MTRRVARVCATFAVAAVGMITGGDTAGAQVRPGGAVPARMPRTTADTVRPAADTSRGRIEWVTEDSVARALLARPGYTVTRYQGPILTFDAVTRAIDIMIGLGDTTKVAVEQGDRLIVADTAITYNEGSGVARVTGRVFSREGEQELTGTGGEYNLRDRSVTIRGGRTTVQTEESWIVSADLLKAVQADSSGRQNYFGRHGNLTSCNDTTHAGMPHYHFAFKELKRTAGNTMVARPAVLYIADIPVMWLPFVFQDMRSGRRSGLMTPRFGFTDFVRNSPSYRRNIENIGYYWAINDFMDADLTVDWLSSTGRREGEAAGYTRFNGDWRYRWIDRYLSGGLGASFQRQQDGDNNIAVSWDHNQEFTRDRKVFASTNWVKDTRIQRQSAINPFAVLATIRSTVNLQDKFGPASVTLGATRTQYPGREEVQQMFPRFDVTTPTLNLRPWLDWTPRFSFEEHRRTDITQTSQAGLGTLFRYDTTGQLVSDAIRQNERTTRASFGTPIVIFGNTLANAFTFADREVEFPQVVRLVSADTAQPDIDRVFVRTYQSTLDWEPSFSLPAFAQSTWKVTPSLGFQNVDQAPFMIRSHLTGGRWVRQSKRPTATLSIAPTFYGLLPGIAGFSRFRHAVAPTFSYTYAPRAGVSDEFLLAQNRSPRDYIGALALNRFTLGLSTNIEGKGRPAAGDTTATAESAAKVKIVSLNFSSLSYDVSRYQKYRADGDDDAFLRGLETSNFGINASSDLLPGVDFSAQYDLFEGSVQSDTARFKPFLTSVSAGFQLNGARNPVMLLSRLFGRAVPATNMATAEIVEPLDDAAARATAVRPIAGSQGRSPQIVVPPRSGWEASFRFTTSRQRPPTGDANIVEFDPTLRCEPARALGAFAYDNCIERANRNPTPDAPVTTPGSGGAFYRVPPTTSLQTDLRFALTQKWSGTWNTSYDVERGEFASHMVSLQRDLHDWRANFSFTQSPTGSFAFSFFIALKAEPDLKFDYNRATYRQEVQR